jgi:hypothetical protein
MSFGRVHSAFDILTKAVQKHRKNPALVILVAELVWSSWVKRNLQVFQGNDSRVPLQIVFRNCIEKIQALEGATETVAKLKVLRENPEFLQHCVDSIRSGNIIV